MSDTDEYRALCGTMRDADQRARDEYETLCERGRDTAAHMQALEDERLLVIARRAAARGTQRLRRERRRGGAP